MSSPINIPPGKDSRSLSEEFESKSLETKNIILAMTGGEKPTSKINLLFSPRCKKNRFRSDSADLSPVTKSILDFHGIKK